MALRYVLFFAALTVAGFADQWEKDYEKAVIKSVQEKKPILLFFTGSDCSGWGMKLKNEIFLKEEFIEKTKGNFVCVEIDFPEHKVVPESIAQQNQALKEKWHVTEIPRLILVNTEGKEIARFGSTCLLGAEFATDLLEIVKKDEYLRAALETLPSFTAEKLEELYKLARELERQEELTRILDAGVARNIPFFLLEKYRFLVESEGSANELLRQKLLETKDRHIILSIALIDFQRLSCDKNMGSNAIRPLEEYLQKYGEEDLENKWRLEMMIAQFYVDSDEWKTALKHAEKAHHFAPENRKEEIARSLEYIREEMTIATSTLR